MGSLNRIENRYRRLKCYINGKLSLEDFNFMLRLALARRCPGKNCESKREVPFGYYSAGVR